MRWWNKICTQTKFVFLTGDSNHISPKKNWFKYQPLRCINTGELGKLLEDHPDQELVKYLLEGYTFGFKLGLTRLPNCRQPCKNPREALRKPEVVQELIDKEVRLGHMLGPFDEPPFEQMVFSLINIVPKAGSVNKYWLIHNLKFPYNNQSVNSCILCNVHWTFRSFRSLPQVSWTHVLISNSWQAWLGIVDQNWLKLALAKLALGQPISLKVVGMPIPVIITVRSKFPFICM